MKWSLFMNILRRSVLYYKDFPRFFENFLNILLLWLQAILFRPYRSSWCAPFLNFVLLWDYLGTLFSFLWLVAVFLRSYRSSWWAPFLYLVKGSSRPNRVNLYYSLLSFLWKLFFNGLFSLLRLRFFFNWFFSLLRL